jgi:hypothetical protein
MKDRDEGQAAPRRTTTFPDSLSICATVVRRASIRRCKHRMMAASRSNPLDDPETA